MLCESDYVCRVNKCGTHTRTPNYTASLTQQLYFRFKFSDRWSSSWLSQTDWYDNTLSTNTKYISKNDNNNDNNNNKIQTREKKLKFTFDSFFRSLFVMFVYYYYCSSSSSISMPTEKFNYVSCYSYFVADHFFCLKFHSECVSVWHKIRQKFISKEIIEKNGILWPNKVFWTTKQAFCLCCWLTDVFHTIIALETKFTLVHMHMTGGRPLPNWNEFNILFVADHLASPDVFFMAQ